MQPIRHALGGLLLERGHLDEAEEVFRKDLQYHPKNPWALVGLISCLKKKSGNGCCESKSIRIEEIAELEETFRNQREANWADHNVEVACACCQIDGA